MGAGTDFATNMGHEIPCVADVFKIVEVGYFGYMYVDSYLVTEESSDIFGAVSTGLTGAVKIMNWDCGLTTEEEAQTAEAVEGEGMIGIPLPA